MQKRYPSYLNLTLDELSQKVQKAFDMMTACSLCPRHCGVDRTKGQRGYCNTGILPFVSSWGPHYGEEKPLVGMYGSGTIFFGNCNLGCIFCQNYTISHLGEGTEMSYQELADIMLGIEARGCHNINLVTPTHQMPMILKSLQIAINKGIHTPIVYNCGGYESLEAIRLLDGIVDIYMPDIKFADPSVSKRLADAEDYFERCKEAVKEMHRQVGDLEIVGGVARRGLLIRHLVLPNGLSGTKAVMEFIAKDISSNTFVNVMDQYYPCYKAREDELLNRRITMQEYKSALKITKEAGIRRDESQIHWGY
ncbi:MAG: radical SAM protein [Thermodesulfovibrionales bacterium]|nr:radical SAM protein [Thermodesulfovibrionales bacterium]